MERKEIESLIANIKDETIKSECEYLFTHASEITVRDNTIAFGHCGDHPFATVNLTTGEIKEYNW